MIKLKITAANSSSQPQYWDGCRRWAHGFPEGLRSEHFRWADLVQET
jgi:hypothetical protein